MPPKKERTEALRQRLLDVAIELLATDGVTAVTTRRVAAVAQTSAPAIYELFGDKAGLIRSVFFEGFGRLRSELDQLPPSDGAVGDLRAVLSVYRRFSADNPRLFEVMYTKPFDSFAPGPDERELGDAVRTILIERAAACTDAGTLQGDPTDIAHGLLALAIGLATQESAGWLGSTSQARGRRWDHAADAMLRGYSA